MSDRRKRDQRYLVACKRCGVEREIGYEPYRRILNGAGSGLCRACADDLLRERPADGKRCGRCGDVKPLTAFGRNRQSRDLHDYVCRSCASERQREKRQRKPWQSRIIAHRQYARRKGATGDVDYQAVIARGLICHICEAPIDADEVSFDHVIPIGRGGAHTTSNVYLAHRLCNSRKTDRLMEELRA